MSQSKNIKYYIYSIIGILIMFGTGFLPAIDPITPVGMKVLGVFIGTIWLWSTTENIWPSVLGIVALGTTGYCTIPEAIANGMSSPILWQLLLIMIIAGGICETPFSTVVINWFMTREAVQGRPWLISAIFLFLTYILVILINIPALILMWTLFYKMVDLVGYTKGEKYVSSMIVGMFVAFIFGNCFFPFTGIRAAMIGAFTNMSGETISYSIFMLVALVLAVCCLILYLLSMKIIFHVDVSKIKGFSVNQLSEQTIKLSLSEKIAIYGFLIGMSFIALMGIVPATSGLGKILNSLSLSGIVAIILVFLSAIRINGVSVVNVPKLASKYIQWGVLFIIIAILPIANAISAEETGINAMVAKIFTPIFEGKSTFVFMLLITLLILILTNIGSNIGMGMILLPIVVQVAQLVHANTAVIALLVIYLANIAYVLPGASPLAALLYGNEWIKVKDIYFYGIFALILTELIVCIVIYPLLSVIM